MKKLIFIAALFCFSAPASADIVGQINDCKQRGFPEECLGDILIQLAQSGSNGASSSFCECRQTRRSGGGSWFKYYYDVYNVRIIGGSERTTPLTEQYAYIGKRTNSGNHYRWDRDRGTARQKCLEHLQTIEQCVK